MSHTFGFIGVGNMGAGMASNLLHADHTVLIHDLDPSKMAPLVTLGAQASDSLEKLARHADIIFLMLPAAQHVQTVCRADLIPHMKPGSFIVDCSTIDVKSTKELALAAQNHDIHFLDAPVSGGISGAEAGTLTFMVGATLPDFKALLPYFTLMGSKAVHCGAVGSGQAVKICNNLMLGIQMISVAEGFILGQKLGVDPQTLFDVITTSSGQCWSITNYCPVPGPVPSSPANYNYDVGFLTHLMAKDLKLAQQAAAEEDLSLTFLQQALAHYQAMIDDGRQDKDFSNIIDFIHHQQ